MLTKALFGLLMLGASWHNDGKAAPMDGKALYLQHCGVCHQADGYGVPFMQPALVDSPKVTGALDQTLEMIFKGSAAVPKGTSDYDNQMPNFKDLSDEEIARITTYVRTSFGGRDAVVSKSRVGAARKQYTTD